MDPLLLVHVLRSGEMLILGGLIGHSLTQHLLAREFRRLAVARREVGVQYRAIQAARSGQSFCDCEWADREDFRTT